MKRTFRSIAALAILGALTSTSFAAPVKANLCTGSTDGLYYFEGNVIKSKVRADELTLNVIGNTGGSVKNLEYLMNGDCDMAIVQNDAWSVYSFTKPEIIPLLDKVSTLHKEVVHFLVNRNAGINKITDLKDNKVVSFANGGAQVTWDSIVKAFGKKLSDEKSKPSVDGSVDGVEALHKAASGDEIQATIYVAGFGTPFMVNDAANKGDKLVLLPISDGFDDVKDVKGKQLYSYVEIPYSSYKNIMPSGMFGRKDVTTIGVDAVLVVRKDWKEKNKPVYSNFLRAVDSSMADIKKRTGQI